MFTRCFLALRRCPVWKAGRSQDAASDHRNHYGMFCLMAGWRLEECCKVSVPQAGETRFMQRLLPK